MSRREHRGSHPCANGRVDNGSKYHCLVELGMIAAFAFTSVHFYEHLPVDYLLK